MTPGVLLCCCSLSASRFNALCIQRCDELEAVGPLWPQQGQTLRSKARWIFSFHSLQTHEFWNLKLCEQLYFFFLFSEYKPAFVRDSCNDVHSYWETKELQRINQLLSSFIQASQGGLSACFSTEICVNWQTHTSNSLKRRHGELYSEEPPVCNSQELEAHLPSNSLQTLGSATFILPAQM